MKFIASVLAAVVAASVTSPVFVSAESVVEEKMGKAERAKKQKGKPVQASSPLRAKSGYQRSLVEPCDNKPSCYAYYGEVDPPAPPASIPQLPASDIVTVYVMPNAPIPDNDPAGVSVTLTAPDCVIEDIDVELDMDHTWVGDLDIQLTSPEGTVVSLLDRPGVPATTFGFSTDLLQGVPITYDDSASDPAESLGDDGSGNTLSVINTPTSIRSHGFDDPGTSSLTDLQDENAVGPWSLFIEDNFGGDIGTLHQFTIHLTCVNPCEPNPCENGGTCAVTDAPGGFTCECPVGFTGPTCEEIDCHLCYSDPKLNPCYPPIGGYGHGYGYGGHGGHDDHPQLYFEHCESKKFVQCSEWGQCYEQHCAHGTRWCQAFQTCIHDDKYKGDIRCPSDDCGSCLEQGPAGSCEVESCLHTVCSLDSYCCYVGWDNICVNEAINYCANGYPQLCTASPSALQAAASLPQSVRQP